VLAPVLGALGCIASIGAQELTGSACRIGLYEGENVELVIAHHGSCMAAIDHAADSREQTHLLRATIDQLAHKGGLAAGWRDEGVATRRVALGTHECFELVEAAVDVTDNVAGGRHLSSPLSCIEQRKQYPVLS